MSRPQKKHKPIKSLFDEVLKVIAKSEYKDEKTIIKDKKIMKKTKSRQTALLLAFFLGMFGLHRFYLGYKITGSIQLLITIIFGFVYYEPNILLINIAWIFIDLFLILFKKFNFEWSAHRSISE